MGKGKNSGAVWVLRGLCVLRMVFSLAELGELFLWQTHSVRHFVGPLAGAFVPVVAVYAVASLLSSAVLLRFATDHMALTEPWERCDVRRWVLVVLLGLTVAMAIPATALSVLWITRMHTDFGAQVKEAIRRVAVDGDSATSLRLDYLQVHYHCCGSAGPLDWLSPASPGFNASAQADEADPWTTTTYDGTVLEADHGEQAGLWRIGEWMSSPGRGRMGCRMLEERRGESVEQAGRVCALPPSCCAFTSPTCSPFFLLFARTRAERDEYRHHFHARGCVSALAEDWVLRLAGPLLVFPTILILLAQVGLWLFVDVSGLLRRKKEAAAGRKTWSEAGKVAESAAVVWGWGWREEALLGTSGMETEREGSMEAHVGGFEDREDSVRDVDVRSARRGEGFTREQLKRRDKKTES